MARTITREDSKGVIELLEEAAHLLRLAPAGCWGAYYVGSLPFVLAVLYFWADMSRSAFARERIVGASMGLAALFVWMKCWHAVFMRKLLAELCGEPQPPWSFPRAVRLLFTQAIIQPWGLLVLGALPASVAKLAIDWPHIDLLHLGLIVAAAVPFPWAYAFWQNACLLGDGDEQSSVHRTLGSAWRQATMWARQNMLVLLTLLLFGLFVFVNIVEAILLPSALLKIFLGVDTVFTRGGFRVLNTTFLAIVFGLMYLCMDPLVKAFYTLRCFYSRSRRTGQDLQADLMHLVSARRAAAGAFVAGLAVLLCGASRGRACDTPGAGCHGHASCAWPCREPRPCPAGLAMPCGDAAGPPAAPKKQGISPDELDESVRRVIGRREYAWRMPRERKKESKAKSFLDSASEKIGQWLKSLFESLSKDRKPKPREVPLRPPRERQRGVSWVGALRPVLYVLLAAAVVVLLVLLLQAYRKRSRREPKKAEAAAATPDLEDEDVTAEDLPEGGWLDLAKELLRKGNRRLALRAMYLASLALLAERSLIAVARFKSNGDYRAELQRRAHALPDLVAAFAQNVNYFEDAWYGMHDVTDGIVRGFVANQRRIRDIAEA